MCQGQPKHTRLNLPCTVPLRPAVYAPPPPLPLSLSSLLALALIFVHIPAPASAQQRGARATTKSASDELPVLLFDIAGSGDDNAPVIDPDETPAGQTRLKTVCERATEIYRERDLVETERRPIAGQRDVIVGEIQQLQSVMIEADKARTAARNQMANVQRNLNNAGDPSERSQLQQRQRNLQNTINQADTIIGTNQGEITKRQPALNALNTALMPLDSRLLKLWQELDASRKQWLELRTPHEKYARADFRGLKAVIDDWLLIDGLWAQCYCWAALCSYELGDYERASELIEKADKLRVEVYKSKRAWPQITALQALVCLQMPGQRSKSAGLVTKAITSADKKTDWETFFLAGRALLENERTASRAQAHLKTALTIRPNCNCAKYWMGCLLTTTGDARVRDVAAGTKLLAGLWDRTGQRSWRISFALVRAYDASQNAAQAQLYWDKTLALAPDRERGGLQEERKLAAAKAAAWDQDEPAPPPAKSKTSSKSKKS